ncbi:ER lumen protein retaining receptor [Babesia duncani]|uniref:ER lumen protein retaining receptor n=1 Tax=Babesia duncani TaxID=323732 RepID=A0AAD9PNA9_9APIC|nr:ER lumen protein retaining receptor [Babesia duncani]KAK2197977.1 ER lumen protein retaining receptor [Babesia duncani]
MKEELFSASVRERLRRQLQDNKGHVRLYCGFFGVLFLLYLFFSDGDFSFLLTLSSLVSLLSFVVVAYSIDCAGTCTGISLQTIYCYVVLLGSRLCSIVPYQGYLPSDSSGDFLYQFSEFLCLVFAVYVAYQCCVKYKSTYDTNEDQITAKYLLIPSLVLAVILHPSLNRNTLTDICWAFALYVETLAVLPQLLMFQKRVCLQMLISMI